MERLATKQLIRWKEGRGERKPLLLGGARQAGKTWLLKDFAKKHYENSIHVNLDVNRRVASFFDNDIAPDTIIKLLEAEFRQPIVPGKTLLVLDEIQSCERALTSLKYFAEDAPQYHVAAAGSLLGVAINREQYSYPVGKVHEMRLYPLDFEEFLMALDDGLLLGAIKEGFNSKKPLLDALHTLAIERYREYLVTGGMPAVVLAYVHERSFVDLPQLQQELTSSYYADMARYASPSETVRIRACYDSLPSQLSKENHKFMYKLVQRGGTASIFGEAIGWLTLSGVVLKCQRTSEGSQPISTEADLSAFKLYCTDVGLLGMQAGVRASDVLMGTPYHFQGAMTENYVAQQLVVRGYSLYYWTSKNTAEVDFAVQSQAGVCAIEVKSSLNTRSRSLRQFINRYGPERAVRLSLKPFGSADGIFAVPLYAAFCL
jgi:predicted AAA+ superfamily ATPase